MLRGRSHQGRTTLVTLTKQTSPITNYIASQLHFGRWDPRSCSTKNMNLDISCRLARYSASKSIIEQQRSFGFHTVSSRDSQDLQQQIHHGPSLHQTLLF